MPRLIISQHTGKLIQEQTLPGFTFRDTATPPAASDLAARGTPFIVATDQRPSAGLPGLLAQAPFLAKPFEVPELDGSSSNPFRASPASALSVRAHAARPPSYVAKAEKKDRTTAEVDEIMQR